MLPSRLQTLTFDKAFNQNLENGRAAIRLQTLTFGKAFKQNLEKGRAAIQVLQEASRSGDGSPRTSQQMEL